MNFWWGLFIGLFAGANIGVVVAGLMAGAKREESSQEYLKDGMKMAEAPAKTSQVGRPLADASGDPVF